MLTIIGTSTGVLIICPSWTFYGLEKICSQNLWEPLILYVLLGRKGGILGVTPTSTLVGIAFSKKTVLDSGLSALSTSSFCFC